ncbi:MAG: GNAT family N-acetyltransferase [Clostridia bacterium]
MIRFADDELYEKSKYLWNECFLGDELGFSDFFYENYSSPKNVLTYLDDTNGDILSMLHMFHRDMKFGGKTVPILFLSGIATSKNARNKGYSRALIEKVKILAKNSDYAAILLQPAVSGFYEKFGFFTFVKRKEYLVTSENLSDVPDFDLIDPDPESLLTIYNDAYSNVNGMFKRDLTFMKIKLMEYRETALCFFCENGYAFGSIENSVLCIDEVFGSTALSCVKALLKITGAKLARIPSIYNWRYDFRYDPFNMINLCENFKDGYTPKSSESETLFAVDRW